MVRAEGFEPPRLASLEPKSSASANSATPARPRRSQTLRRRRRVHSIARGAVEQAQPWPFGWLLAFEAGPRRRIEDGVGVEAIDAIKVGEVARLAEMLDAQRVDAMPRHGAEPGQRRRMAVDEGDERRILAERREQPRDVALLAAAQSLEPAGMEPIGRSDREQAGAGNVLEQHLERRERLGGHRAGIGDGQLGTGLW